MNQNLRLAHPRGMKPGPRVGNRDQAMPHDRRFFSVPVGNKNPGIVERADNLVKANIGGVVGQTAEHDIHPIPADGPQQLQATCVSTDKEGHFDAINVCCR